MAGRVLVFGSGGRVGRLLLKALSGRIVLGPRSAEVDIRRADQVRRVVEEFKPDAVVNAAGMADPDLCEDRPGEAYAVNVDGARNVAEASRGCPLILFSTDHVFDGKSGPYAEGDATGPLNVYGRTKLEAERIVQAVHPRSLVVRTTLVFAPGGRDFFNVLLQAEEPRPCWTDHVATYTYGPNLAEAAVELMGAGETGLWHLAGPGMLNRHEFALKVAARFGLDPARFLPVSIREAPPRAPRPLRAGLRPDKAQKALRTKLLSVDEALELAYRSHGGAA